MTNQPQKNKLLTGVFKSIVYFVIFIQFIAIGYLIVKIVRSKLSNTKPTVTFLTIQHDIYPVNPQDGLERFYEPMPNINIEFTRSWISYKATLTINKDTLNERYDYSVDKKPGVFRIITLGNSHTFGGYVDTKNNWTEVLEDMLNKQTCGKLSKFEVINLGVAGYDLEYEVERYKVRGQKYKPDLVLWYVNSPDKINEYMLKTEREIEKSMNINRNQKEYYNKDGVQYPTWAKAVEQMEQNVGKPYMLAYQKKVLERMDGLYRGPLLLFNFNKNKSLADYNNLFEQFVKTRSNRAFFQNPRFLEDMSGMTLYDGHPSAQGHQYIAKTIIDYLKGQKNIAIPCISAK